MIVSASRRSTNHRIGEQMDSDALAVAHRMSCRFRMRWTYDQRCAIGKFRACFFDDAIDLRWWSWSYATPIAPIAVMRRRVHRSGYLAAVHSGFEPVSFYEDTVYPVRHQLDVQGLFNFTPLAAA